jgi:hypothetical protein
MLFIQKTVIGNYSYDNTSTTVLTEVNSCSKQFYSEKFFLDNKLKDLLREVLFGIELSEEKLHWIFTKTRLATFTKLLVLIVSLIVLWTHKVKTRK